jgi:hypothetical protein
MSTSAARVTEQPAIPEIANGHMLRQCLECRAPMLLMSATPLQAWPGVIRKTYQCLVCQSVDLQTVPIHSN